MRLARMLSGGELECLNKANNSPQVAAIDKLVTDLSKNWRPTGYYRPADIQGVLAVLESEAQAVGTAIASAPMSTGDARSVKDQAFADILRRYTDRSKGYLQAIADAQRSGATAINAPGFKDFVIGAMRSISDGYVTAAVLQCRQTWLESILDRGYKAMATIGGIAAKVGGVVVDVGESVVNAVDSAFSIAKFLIRAAPFIAIGLVGLIAYSVVQRGSFGHLIPRRFRSEPRVAGLLAPPRRRR